MPHTMSRYSLSRSVRTALFVSLLLMAFGASLAQGQTLDFERSRYSPGGYYRYTETGDLTVRVQAWGNVRYPGLHEVPQETRVSTLLSLAGGPVLAERRRQDERTIRVRFYRTDADGQMALVFEQLMTNDLAALEQDPLLQEGDVLVVDSVLKVGYTWRDYLPIASVATSIAVLIVQLVR